VETDFSLAMMSAVLIAFEVGPFWMYLKRLWYILVDGKEKIPFVLHVCRFHAQDFIMNNIKKHFGRREEAARILPVLETWMHGSVIDWSINYCIICNLKIF